MKYSIILPCYNATACLSACMDSLFANDLSDSEIILVDDGSTDDFAGWCRGYFACDLEKSETSKTINWKDATVKIIMKANQGVSAARNTGISYATGDYVLFVDPDDTVTVDYISTISQEFFQNDCDFLLLGFYQIWEEEGTAGEPQAVLPLRAYNLNSQQEAIKELLPNFIGESLASIDHWLYHGVFIPYQEFGAVWRCAYRRDIIERNGIRFSLDIKLKEDMMFNSEYIAHICTARSCMKPLYIYTVRKSGAMRRNRGNTLLANEQALLAERERICSDLRDRGYDQVSYLWYAASNVFSVFGIMRSVDFSMWKEVKRYIKHPTVQASIKAAPISLRKPAYFVRIMLLKLKLHWVLFLCYKIWGWLKTRFHLGK